MTPTEVAATLRKFNEWRRTPSDGWREHPTSKEITAAIDAAVEMIEAAEKERDALRAKIAEMEQQAPARLVIATAYRWRYRGAVMWQYGELTEETARRAKEHNHEVQPLYALPGAQAQPASSIPVEAIGKMLADVMAVAVSNGANSVSMPDEYVEVAVWLQGECPTQPAPSVPEGWQLVPIEPTQEMLDATSWPNCAGTDYKKMLAAAPRSEAKP